MTKKQRERVNARFALAVLLAEESSVLTLGDSNTGCLAERLFCLAHILHRIHERQCNGYPVKSYGVFPIYDWDEEAAKRDERREEKIMQNLRDISQKFGLAFCVDGDPRGYAIKMLTPKTGKSNTLALGVGYAWGIGD